MYQKVRGAGPAPATSFMALYGYCWCLQTTISTKKPPFYLTLITGFRLRARYNSQSGWKFLIIYHIEHASQLLYIFNRIRGETTASAHASLSAVILLISISVSEICCLFPYLNYLLISPLCPKLFSPHSIF